MNICSMKSSAQPRRRPHRSALFTYAEKNVASAFEFASRLAQVRDVQDLAKLQMDFIQAQMQAMTEQAKNLSETATKAMMDGLKSPTKGGLSS